MGVVRAREVNESEPQPLPFRLPQRTALLATIASEETQSSSCASSSASDADFQQSTGSTGPLATSGPTSVDKVPQVPAGVDPTLVPTRASEVSNDEEPMDKANRALLALQSDLHVTSDSDVQGRTILGQQAQKELSSDLSLFSEGDEHDRISLSANARRVFSELNDFVSHQSS